MEREDFIFRVVWKGNIVAKNHILTHAWFTTHDTRMVIWDGVLKAAVRHNIHTCMPGNMRCGFEAVLVFSIHETI